VTRSPLHPALAAGRWYELTLMEQLKVGRVYALREGSGPPNDASPGAAYLVPDPAASSTIRRSTRAVAERR
jgi:hypothetical protein